MRIDDLLQREDFGSVLVSTLERYWTGRFGRDYCVRWVMPGETPPQGQRWRGNKYLNVFFTSDVRPTAFANTMREYGSTRQRWRRPLQAAYVWLGSISPLRAAMTQLVFTAAPDVPASDDTLVMGGNRRIRLLHPRAGRTVVVLKTSYPASSITNDLHLRQSRALPCAPRIHTADALGTWYEEEFVSGTPINRLPPGDELPLRRNASAALLRELIVPTLRPVAARRYVESLADRVEAAARHESIPNELQAQPSRIARSLRERLLGALGPTDELPSAMSHGDFQPANILRPDDSRAIVVIDWEAVATRHAAYDALVLTLDTRQDRSWASRFDPWIRDGAEATTSWPGCENRRERLLSGAVFLLEESLAILSDAARPMSAKPLPSLAHHLDQVARAAAALQWL